MYEGTEIVLPFESDEEMRTAAIFVGELFKTNVRFFVKVDIHVLRITITGY